MPCQFYGFPISDCKVHFISAKLAHNIHSQTISQTNMNIMSQTKFRALENRASCTAAKQCVCDYFNGARGFGGQKCSASSENRSSFVAHLSPSPVTGKALCTNQKPRSTDKTKQNVLILWPRPPCIAWCPETRTDERFNFSSMLISFY